MTSPEKPWQPVVEPTARPTAQPAGPLPLPQAATPQFPQPQPQLPLQALPLSLPPLPPESLPPESPESLPPGSTALPSRNRTPVIALSALAAFFAIVTGLFTWLLVNESATRDRHAAIRAEDERVAAEIADQLEQADQNLAGTRSHESALTAQQDLLTRCVDATKGYFDLPPEDTPESSRLFRIMYDVCPQI